MRKGDTTRVSPSSRRWEGKLSEIAQVCQLHPNGYQVGKRKNRFFTSHLGKLIFLVSCVGRANAHEFIKFTVNHTLPTCFRFFSFRSRRLSRLSAWIRTRRALARKSDAAALSGRGGKCPKTKILTKQRETDKLTKLSNRDRETVIEREKRWGKVTKRQ